MATKTTGAAKPGAKTPRAKAASASPVATSELDKAAAQAALSNQGSGDKGTTDGAAGSVPGAGAADGAPAGGTGSAEVAAAGGAGSAGDPPPGDAGSADGAAAGATSGMVTGGDGAGEGVGLINELQGSTGLGGLTDEQMAAAELLAGAAARSENDELHAALAPVLSRLLVNQTPGEQRLPRLGVVIAAGESLVIGFRDEKHLEACEKQIDQLRLLGGWDEGCGLHWGLDE